MRSTICFCLALLLAGLACADVAAQSSPEPPAQTTETKPAARPTLSLPPPKNDLSGDHQAPAVGGLGSLINTMGALALVVGLFLLVAWIFKRSSKQAAIGDASQLVRVIARTQLGAGQTAQVIRFGNQLLLVAQTSNQSQTLATISDAEEVERLCELCNTASDRSTEAPLSLSTVVDSFLRPNPRASTSR